MPRVCSLIDANIVSDGKRKVFKFSLKPVEKKSFGGVVDLPHNRLIPTAVKVKCGDATLVSEGNADQKRICISITTFRFQKAEAVWPRRTFDCCVQSTISKNQTGFCRSHRGFTLARWPRHTFKSCPANLGSLKLRAIQHDDYVVFFRRRFFAPA